MREWKPNVNRININFYFSKLKMKIQSINNLSELILVGIIFDMTIKTFEASGVKMHWLETCVNRKGIIDFW